MKIAFFVLMLTSGCAASFILLRDMSDKVRRARRLFDLSSFIEERMRLARAPISEIIDSFNSINDDDASLSYLLENEDAEIRRLSDGICRLDITGALTQADLLKNYTERKMRKIKEDTAKKRKVMIVLPPAAALLISLLLI